MKKLLALLMALAMTAMLLAGCSSGGGDAAEEPAAEATEEAAEEAAEPAEEAAEPAGEALKMCMITDAGGLGDNGFNDMSWAGMEKARDDFGFEIGIIESTEAAQYVANITQACDQGYNIIVCVGFLLADPVAEVAPMYPDVKFLLMDGEVEGENVYSFKYKMNEASFIVGALTAKYLPDSDTYGVVIGMEIPDTISWESGFIAGVKAINPDATVLKSTVGSFQDPDIAKEMALKMFDQGAAAVMEVSSGGAIGVIEAAVEADKYFIATDKSKEDQGPGHEWLACLAGRDAAVYEAAKEISEGTDEPGVKILTTADGVFGIPDYTEERLGADAVELAATLQQMIIDGEIEVPNSVEEAEAFQKLDL